MPEDVDLLQSCWSGFYQSFLAQTHSDTVTSSIIWLNKTYNNLVAGVIIDFKDTWSLASTLVW